VLRPSAYTNFTSIVHCNTTDGFYPKFANDVRKQGGADVPPAAAFAGVSSLDVHEKWSGYLGQLVPFALTATATAADVGVDDDDNGDDDEESKIHGDGGSGVTAFWTVASKNSGRYDSAFVSDAARLWAPLMTPGVVAAMVRQRYYAVSRHRHLRLLSQMQMQNRLTFLSSYTRRHAHADTHTHQHTHLLTRRQCAEMLSQRDQGHGAAVLTEGPVCTMLARYRTFAVVGDDNDAVAANETAVAAAVAAAAASARGVSADDGSGGGSGVSGALSFAQALPSAMLTAACQRLGLPFAPTIVVPAAAVRSFIET
jgi:hypothetical protein